MKLLEFFNFDRAEKKIVFRSEIFGRPGVQNGHNSV